MIVLGVTGMRAVGKSTVSKIFARFGAIVFDADAMCRCMYETKQTLIDSIGRAFPESLANNKVDRVALSKSLESKRDLLLLERLVNNSLIEQLRIFMSENRIRNRRLVILDVPLLFESGFDKYCDFTVVVVALPGEVSRRLGIQNLAQDKAGIASFLSARRMGARKYRGRANFIIHSGLSKGYLVKQVKSIVNRVAESQ